MARTVEQKALHVRYQTSLMSKKRDIIRAYKLARGCQDCGRMDFPSYVLEFAHRDPSTKNPFLRRTSTKTALAGAKKNGWLGLSYEDIAIELEKCDILCANCHRIRTAHELGWTED